MKNIVYALGVLVVCANVGAMNLDGNFRECRKGQGARFNEALFETEEQDRRAPLPVPDIVSAERQQEMIPNII